MSNILQVVVLLFVFAIVGAIPFLLSGALTSTTSTQGIAAAAPSQAAPTIQLVGGVQEMSIYGSSNGYSPASFTVKKGVPVKIKFSADQYAGCGRQLIMKEFGISLLASPGQVVEAQFTPTQEGRFTYRCSMGMMRGTLAVIA